jgi:hypothetical protein
MLLVVQLQVHYVSKPPVTLLEIILIKSCGRHTVGLIRRHRVKHHNPNSEHNAIKPRYNWNIAESGVKHLNPNPYLIMTHE